MTWSQQYDPLGNAMLSTLLAALPVVVLLGSIAALKIRIHIAALLGLLVALGVAVLVYHMPVKLAAATTVFGAAYGLFPIGWIILNLIFLYQLTVEKGYFTILRSSLATFAPDPRIQVILIAFSFGAFFEGAAGFGTPVAVTAAILIQLGFKPLAASGLSLIANTAPVAFGALGTPVIALSKVTGISEIALSAMIGRQLPFFSLIVPFWVVWAMVGFRGMLEIWPAALTAGLAFAIPQFLVSNFHGPWLVDIVAALCSMGAVAVLLRFWQPRNIWKLPKTEEALPTVASVQHTPTAVRKAWAPWILLSCFVFLWGIPKVKTFFDGASSPKFEVAQLHNAIVRVAPVVPPPTLENPTKPEPAIFILNWLSATGTGILVAALVAGLAMGFSFGEMFRTYGKTIYRVRYSLITIAAMLALGYVTRYSGTDATLGLALAKTGKLYPFFGTLLGWLGVALTGSDTASNVLFGSLQKITAQQTGISPTLMAAANSSGGVMGKMVDAQSIVVASTATNWYGREGDILRYVFFHSIALAALVGIWVFLQAYVFPFTTMVVK
ncbi:MAG: glycolate permease GlcA [Pedosphaera sp.]|nr:glycolate permease GlcA [Pedosphaera sp.]